LLLPPNPAVATGQVTTNTTCHLFNPITVIVRPGHHQYRPIVIQVILSSIFSAAVAYAFAIIAAASSLFLLISPP
jgi:hypothetical protein